MEIKRRFSQKALEDFELIDKAVAGEEQAYARLMEKHRKSVYYTMLKLIRNVDDAEDLTIEAFTKAFKKLADFKKNYSFSTWLHKIASNNCIDFLRKKRLDTTSIDSQVKNDDGDTITIDIRDKSLDPQEKAIKSQKIEIIREFVNLLPSKYQKLVKLRYFKEYSYDEIAQELEAPLGTIKAQLHRARELLTDLVKKQKHFF